LTCSPYFVPLKGLLGETRRTSPLLVCSFARFLVCSYVLIVFHTEPAVVMAEPPHETCGCHDIGATQNLWLRYIRSNCYTTPVAVVHTVAFYINDMEPLTCLCPRCAWIDGGCVTTAQPNMPPSSRTRSHSFPFYEYGSWSCTAMLL
jgi:hypothetical protein